jgi:hypothetical protein
MSPEALICAYAMSVALGIPITLGWTISLFWLLNKQIGPSQTDSTTRIWWIPMAIGIFERAIATTLIIWTPKIIAPFIGGWIALKVAGGWGLLKEPTTRNRATFFIGLLGSIVSLGWAIAWGLYVMPGAVKLLNN